MTTTWQDYLTAEERSITNRWAMGGDSCIGKVRSRWDSTVPGAPFFRTKSAAFDFLTRFVCDSIPIRCKLRMPR